MDNQQPILFRHRVLWHILFWVVIYGFYTLTYGAYNNEYNAEFIANVYLTPVRIIGTYIMIYFIIPAFLLKRRYKGFVLFTVLHIVLYGVAIAYVIHTFIICPWCLYVKDFPFGMRLVLESIASNYEIPAVAATIKFFKNWYIEKQANQSLEKEKLEAELNFLKSQLNPHFLFNTLNNLYALTLKKSDTAPDTVIKLSEMLDYMLYRSNVKEANLSDEIKLIKNYIELEEIRYGSRLDLKVDIKGDTAGKKLAPLILLPFIENSFKHGACKDISIPFIHIEIVIKEECLKLNIANSFDSASQSDKETDDGIGLKNVKRRLDLLYPNKHVLDIDKTDHQFKVYLCLSWSQENKDCSKNPNV